MFCHCVTSYQELVNHLLIWTIKQTSLMLEPRSFAIKNFVANFIKQKGMAIFLNAYVYVWCLCMEEETEGSLLRFKWLFSCVGVLNTSVALHMP